MTKPQLFTAHPWHGIPLGDRAPQIVTSFIEIVPTDTVKFEIDKQTGHLKVDRPQKYSNQCPALYGFLPQTYCAERVGAYCAQESGKEVTYGDRDPLDICVITERPILTGAIQVQAIPVGGLRLIDKKEADDKILAVLEGDGVFGSMRDVSELPPALVDRIRHYFLTYKEIPGDTERKVEIAGVYGRDTALEVIRLSVEDYRAHYS